MMDFINLNLDFEENSLYILEYIHLDEFGNYLIDSVNSKIYIVYTSGYKLVIKMQQYDVSSDTFGYIPNDKYESCQIALYLPNDENAQFRLYCTNEQYGSEITVYINNRNVYINNCLDKEQIIGQHIKYTSITHDSYTYSNDEFYINEETLLELCNTIATKPIEIDILNILQKIFSLYSDHFTKFNINTDNIFKIFTDDDKNWKYILKYIIKYDEIEPVIMKLPDIII
jgi:hypothetical protein